MCYVEDSYPISFNPDLIGVDILFCEAKNCSSVAASASRRVCCNAMRSPQTPESPTRCHQSGFGGVTVFARKQSLMKVLK
jgi:hypothetical protein